MFAKVKSLGIFGLNAFEVTVECDISRGLPRFDIVGLPDAVVKESRERVRASMKNCHLEFPVSRITVNIAPADIKKEGALYDLPVFVSILKASGQIKGDTEAYAYIGELSLDGEIRRVNGVLPMLIEAKNKGIKSVFIPFDNALEGGVLEGIEALPVKNVFEVMQHISGEKSVAPAKSENLIDREITYDVDFSDVKGQSEAKRALEIAAAGGHNCLMIGPPGSGKSMLAKRIPTILPDMSFDEKLETTMIYSIAGDIPDGQAIIDKRPFRSPHHTVSAQALTGGGSSPKPGEISLAHNGVIFMDEFPEFDRRAKESMRQPLEDGIVNISRTAGSVSYPSNIMLIAAMNPCPCGFYGHPTKECSCTDAAKKRYMDKISGPILDRIDIHIEVAPVEYEQLSGKGNEEKSEEIKKRVNKARSIQQKRFEGTNVSCNAKMTPRMTKEFCILSDDANELLKASFEKLGLSARAYDKILRIARTIADLDGAEDIEISHIAEALQYRSLDRKYWNKV
ncbi:MAG: YifB family Mg chelatase-like AAA ATPase [Eubacteriales bacterium]|nr:YifB family Mg chelatase-like AAA ATPase [Eubacteriales bacterium]